MNVMELPVVVGVDGSESALRALDRAAEEAALRDTELRVVYASLWERYEGAALADDLGGTPAEPVLARDIVESAARRARQRHPGLRVTADTVPEEPEYALVRESRNASLLVTGSRGRSGLSEALLGSVSLTVAGHAHCPVLVVRGEPAVRPHGRIVVGVGAESAEALRFAADEARRRGAVLEAVRAWKAPAQGSPSPAALAGESARHRAERAARELDEAVESALKELADIPGLPDAVPGAEVRRRTVEGPARTVLVDVAEGADLVVVGAKRRPRSFGLQLGRVTHRVLHHAPCPVVVVPERG
ncbi:universal stress protein [Streptomyces sp. NPDC093252]|uniref:universal stress protein n=1 Tax=Streptomyces sp. NPDC093252 TaxID=3154980 RepID=UPI00343478FD